MKGLAFSSSKDAAKAGKYAEAVANEPQVSFRVARGMEDMLQVYAVRSIVFVNDQKCPFAEEFDGNDFAATHVLGFLGDEPVGTLRLRFFADFVKLERVAVRKEYRKHQIAVHMIRYAMQLSSQKGYTRLYGHIERRLMKFWTHFGFVERPDHGQRERLVFSDREYVEAFCDLEANPQSVDIHSSPYVLNRPEGEWERAGVLDYSATREAVNV